jgi:hypothetical protein
MRHTLTSLKPVDYAKECRRLLDAICKYNAGEGGLL